jgi:3-phosphoshikimate 1-carboxyvinyltransferase
MSETGVLVENITTSSRQGDRVMLDYLRVMGADVRVVGNAVAVKKGEWPLKPVSIDLSDSIDLLPTVAVLAALANGTSELRGIQRARIKESNRVTAMREGLSKFGVKFNEFKEYLTIEGLNTSKKTDDDDSGTKETLLEDAQDFFDEHPKQPEIVVDSFNDHRIAMAFAVMGSAIGNTTIINAECVKKTFPNFWNALKDVGAEIKAYE